MKKYYDENIPNGQAIIKKWGNSQGIRLPKDILDSLNLVENDKLYLYVDTDSKALVLKKAQKKKSRMEERLEVFYQRPIDKIFAVESVQEVDWGTPYGEEIW